MEGIFTEFENENALRSYPFASGCLPVDDAGAEMPAGLFVDAAIYPVNPTGTIYLSEISAEGLFSISDDTGVIMTGTATGNRVDFHDTSAMKRHVGTLMASSADSLAYFAVGATKTYTSDRAAFASSCVFPVVIDGVTSMSIDSSEPVPGHMGFYNGRTDTIRVSSTKLSDGRYTIRFDILPRPSQSEEGSIRRIVCVVDGQTPFRIEKLAYNIVLLTLDGISRDSLCSSVHRENHLEMADTCECEKPPLPSETPLPETFQLEEVYIPPDTTEDREEGGIPEGADNAFYLVVSNVLGYGNPLSITLEDGVVSPRTDTSGIVVNGVESTVKDDVLMDDMTSKGVVLQVPGLSGGAA